MTADERIRKHGLSEDWAYVLGIMIGQMLQRMSPSEVLTIIRLTMEENGYDTHERSSHS